MANEIQELKFQVGEVWKGVYSSSTAYGLANVVQDPTGLSVYRSLKSGNVGHPLSDASWWFRIIDMSSIKAESDRIAALNQTIAQDEALRVAAEELRQQHEAARIAAETQRDEAEQARINAEQARVNAESARATAEQQRITAEQGRVSAESARVQAEQARVLAETLRANAEDQRAANEQNRIAAEQQRIERAEQDHQRAESDHATYVDSLGAFDISSYHATDGVLAKYADLAAALGTNGANIPDDLRKGGMSVKFVQSSDNKYVKYFCNSQTFTTDVNAWEKMNLEEKVSQLGQEINIGSVGLGVQVWGIGDVDISANGPWIWYEGDGYNTRVCTMTPIRLKAGTIIKLSDYTKARFYIGWRIGNTYYRHEGWITSGEFECPVDGEYVINIDSIPAAIQTDYHDLADLILVLTPYDAERASDADVKNNRDEQTQQIRYYTPIFTIVTIDIPGNGQPWYWHYDDGNKADIGTKYPIFLKQGSTIRLTDYSAAKMYIGWRVNGVYSRHEGWIESGVFTCPTDAEYVISIRPIPLVEQESYEALANLIIIANPIASNSAPKTDVDTYRSEQEQQIHYYTPVFAVGTLDIPANGPWTWYYGDGYDTNVVTKYPVFLKKNTIIKLSDYTNARMYIGWRDANNVYSRQGWISSEYFRCPISGEYVVNIQSVPLTTQSSIHNLANLLQIENETYLMALRNHGMYNPFMNAPYYAHLAVNSFMKNGAGQNAIPNNSLFEIDAAARLGYKIVELKPKVTSDGKYITIHGSGGNFSTSVYSLDETDITNVPINSKSLAWIKENVRYKSDVAKYRTAIPTLEEALICCKENCIAAFIEAINYDIIDICRQYLSDGSLMLYAAPIDTREQTGFGGFIFQWYNLSTFTKDYILNEARNYGAPFIAGIGGTLMGTLGDTGTQELIDALHKDNFLVSCASSGNELRKFFRFGVDACAALYQTNPIDGGNVYDLDGEPEQFSTTGVIENNEITLENGQSVSCGNTDVLPLGRCYLVMRFSGAVNIQFGCGGGIRSAQSDGSDIYFDSDYLITANDTLIITATASTTISMLVYKSQKC